jgi:hypothetical protein
MDPGRGLQLIGAGMSGDVENSQAVRDAERAAADLAQSLRAGATSSEIAELTTAKANADERVDTLRRRVEPPHGKSQQASADLLERRQRQRGAMRAEMNDENRQRDHAALSNPPPSTADAAAKRQQHGQAEEASP